MQRSAKVALVAVVVVILAGGAAFWWFVLRDDAPERAGLPERAATDTVPADGGEDGADGTWVVVEGDREVFVGYRIQELFGGETVEKTAVGRTRDVTGTLVVDGDTIVEAEVSADLANLVSDSSRRDNTLRGQGLETDTFPEATFVLDGPVQLPAAPVVGEPAAVTATGALTLHGQTRDVTVELEARWNGDTIDVAGGTEIVLADFGIEAISNPFVSIADTGELELQLTYAPAADS